MEDIKDILHDWLLGDSPEYLEILQKNSQEDINPNHWKRYEAFNRFIHFVNIYTGETL